MRVTNNAMTRNYLTNLNKNLSRLNDSGTRLQTGREFTKMSQNVSSGTRALSIRTHLYKNEQIQANVKKAGETLAVAESNMMSIEGVLNSVHEQTIAALNGTNESSSDIYAANFDSLKKQIVEFANCNYNDTYILGGTNNQTAPFEVKDGELLYNGINVKDIEKIDGTFVANGEKVPYSEDIFMDIGIGISIKNGVVDSRTAFNMSVSGLECLGYGKSEIKYQDIKGNEHTFEAPNNAYAILDEMSKCLNEKDFSKLSALNDHLKKNINNLVTEIADVGVRSNYLENHTSRLEDSEYVMTGIQNDLEYINDTDELINQKNLEYSWLLTLQYGGKVIPQSLMDYMR